MKTSDYPKMLKAFLFEKLILKENYAQRLKRIISTYILFKLIPTRATLIIPWHKKIYLAVSKNDSGLKNNLYFGYAEKEMALFDFFAKILEYHKDIFKLTFVDCGANSGQYSLKAANTNVFKQVISFEPCGKSYQRLEMNVSINKLSSIIKTFPFALGESEYTASLSSSLDQENYIVLKSDKINNSEIIQVKRLDSFSELSGCHLVIKIDVEGFEENVLNGATKLFEGNMVLLVIMECNDSSLKNYQIDRHKASSILLKYGFKPYDLTIRSNDVAMCPIMPWVLLESKKDDNIIFVNSKLVSAFDKSNTFELDSQKTIKNILRIYGTLR